MEIVAPAVQTVNANQNVLFTNTITCGNCSIGHRAGSGLVSLKGNTNQCRARYKVTFGANIAIPEEETVGPISVAISIDGEGLQSSTMIVTPTVVNAFFNVFGAAFVDVPRGCCATITVTNESTIPILVQNANLIAERVA